LSNKKDNKLKECYCNYCAAQWNNFTALTQEEERNLNEIIRLIERKTGISDDTGI